MPIYEYYCQSCHQTHEVIQKINDPLLSECSDCKGKLERLISSTSFHLKGEGWYVTDFKNPKKTEAQKTPTEGSSLSTESKTVSAPTESTTTTTSTETKDTK